MPIIVSQTYEIVTEESAEHGDAAERGFDFENQSYGFRELVEYIQDEGFCFPSDSPGVPRWLTSDVIKDRAWLELGENKTVSLHPASDARSLRYWAKACKACGIV